jgi:hypothetical protein
MSGRAGSTPPASPVCRAKAWTRSPRSTPTRSGPRSVRLAESAPRPSSKKCWIGSSPGRPSDPRGFDPISVDLTSVAAGRGRRVCRSGLVSADAPRSIPPADPPSPPRCRKRCHAPTPCVRAAADPARHRAGHVVVGAGGGAGLPPAARAVCGRIPDDPVQGRGVIGDDLNGVLRAVDGVSPWLHDRGGRGAGHLAANAHAGAAGRRRCSC